MPLPAGTGLSRRSFLARFSGLALAVFGGAALSPRALDAGIAAAEAAGEHRVLVSIFCSAAWTRCRCSRRSATRATRRCAARSRSPADPAFAFGEDYRLRWHPPLRRFATCTPQASSA